MLDVGWPELLIVLVVVVLIFGPGRLAKTMGELAKGLRSFRDSVSSEENSESVSSDSVTDTKPDPK
jgi:sec-independent protein translocase protein TatA